MADNVQITAGSGTTIRTSDVAGVETQVVKVSLGLDGAEDTLLDSGQQTMANSMPVALASNQSSLPVTPAATESHLGASGGNTAEIDVTPTLTVHATYVSGDYVGTSGTAMTFAGAARINGGTGIIQSAVLIDYAAQSISCELWLFDTAPTPPADSAAWSISDAGSARCIGVIPFSTYYASALNSVAPVGSVGLGFKAAGGATAIYGCLVTRGAPAYASGDLTVRLVILED